MLFIFQCDNIFFVARLMAHRQMVRHWTLTPAFQGSNPCGPAQKMILWNHLFLFCLKNMYPRATRIYIVRYGQALAQFGCPSRTKFVSINCDVINFSDLYNTICLRKKAQDIFNDYIGPSPNGKALDSDSSISRFESLWAS